MPTTNINPAAIPGPYIALQPAANSLNVVTTVADTGQHNSFVATGNEILYAHNSDAGGAHAISIYSVVDPFNRTGDITAYSIAASKTVLFSFKDPNGLRGWKQTGAGNIVEFSGATTDILFAVLTAP